MIVNNDWQPITDFAEDDGVKVDLWLEVDASPRSMGMADSFRVVNCHRQDNHWFDEKGEGLYLEYITHWAPIIEPV